MKSPFDFKPTDVIQADAARASASRANGAKGGRPITPKSYHISNLGSAGDSIPHDRDGYTYTSQAGWMTADMGADLDGMTRTERLEWAKDQAKASREAIAEAEQAVSAFRLTQSNS